MALVDYLNEQYIKQSRYFRSNYSVPFVKALVESSDDIPFWKSILGKYPKYNIDVATNNDAKLKGLGYKETDAYKIMRGHTLFDEIVKGFISKLYKQNSVVVKSSEIEENFYKFIPINEEVFPTDMIKKVKSLYGE